MRAFNPLTNRFKRAKNRSKNFFKNWIKCIRNSNIMKASSQTNIKSSKITTTNYKNSNRKQLYQNIFWRLIKESST